MLADTPLADVAAYKSEAYARRMENKRAQYREYNANRRDKEAADKEQPPGAGHVPVDDPDPFRRIRKPASECDPPRGLVRWVFDIARSA
jgi:hypothetical protein